MVVNPRGQQATAALGLEDTAARTSAPQALSSVARLRAVNIPMTSAPPVEPRGGNAWRPAGCLEHMAGSSQIKPRENGLKPYDGIVGGLVGP